MYKYFKKLLLGLNIHFSELDRSGIGRIRKKWKECFFPEKISGAYNDQYMWHIYSFRQKPCLSGTEAVAIYTKQRSSGIHVFDEKGSFCFEILGTELPLPDDGVRFNDTYICSRDFRWTMVFTHEHPELGPYFDDTARSLV